MRRKSRASKAAGLQLGCCSVIERGPLATLPPPLNVQVTCFQEKGSMAPRVKRQTNKGTAEEQQPVKKRCGKTAERPTDRLTR